VGSGDLRLLHDSQSKRPGIGGFDPHFFIGLCKYSKTSVIQPFVESPQFGFSQRHKKIPLGLHSDMLAPKALDPSVAGLC